MRRKKNSVNYIIGNRIMNNDHLSCNDLNNDPIFLVYQYFVPDTSGRKKEIKQCLRKNLELNCIEKIHLLNERIYSLEEMGLNETESPKIKQYTGYDRLTYQDFFSFICNSKKEGYYVLCNADIFLDDTLKNIRKSSLSLTKSCYALTRFDISSDLKTTELMSLECSQDVWIVHSKWIKDPKSFNSFNITLGVMGCDGTITRTLHLNNFKVFNECFTVKTYHLHNCNYNTNTIRNNGYRFKLFICKHIKRDKNLNLTEKNNKMNRRLEQYFEKYGLFWQYPVITEKAFFSQHKEQEDYFPFPWATLLDNKLRFNFKSIRNSVSKYTCCQHIYFRKLIPLLKKLKIDKLYSPHKIFREDFIDGIMIVPYPLYAVNVEDPQRNQVFKDVDLLTTERDLLYSFIGTYQDFYLSKIRDRLFTMKHPPNTFVKRTKEWHFERAVYSSSQNKNQKYTMEKNSVDEYNKMLLRSRYSLCPSGSGPNSIRFWESLAVGSIPILLADTLELPHHDLWDKSIVRLPENELHTLEEVLKNITEEEEKTRRENCLKIYNDLKIKLIEKKETPKREIIHYCCGSYF